MGGTDLAGVPAQDALTVALARECRPDERIVWSAPKLARVDWGGFFVWLFAIPWTAFALFWIYLAVGGAIEAQNNAGMAAWAFPLFGLPFVLVGLAMLSMPFLSFLVKGRVLFAISNRRVLRLTRFGDRVWTRSVPLDRLRDITRTQRSTGEGTVTLGLGVYRGYKGRPRKETIALGEVADVMAADRALQMVLSEQP